MDHVDPDCVIQRALKDHVFVGFNSRVVALNRYDGSLMWSWKSPAGTSRFVAVLVDGDRLIVSVQGYTYCLNPANGQQVWANPLKGLGLGTPCLASVHGSTAGPSAAAKELEDQRRHKTAPPTPKPAPDRRRKPRNAGAAHLPQLSQQPAGEPGFGWNWLAR